MWHQNSNDFPIGLAPLEGIGSLPFRLWLTLASTPDFLWTPFLRVTNGFRFKSIHPLFAPDVMDQTILRVPIVPQLLGTQPEDLAPILEGFLASVPFVDINLGCPSSTVTRHGGGSALLREPEKLDRFLSRLCSLIGASRLSLKIRSGWSSHSEFATLLSIIQAYQFALVVVHPRTKDEMYSGQARWDEVEHSALTLTSPVFGSGDITSHISLSEKRTIAPHAAGAMIGRQAVANPWIFSCTSANTERCDDSPELNVPVHCLLDALAAFTAIEDAAKQAPNALLHLCHQNFFQEPCLKSVAKWRMASHQLRALTQPLQAHRTSSQWECTPGVLPRLKMIWCRMRTQLPTAFHGNEFLQVESFPDFALLLESAIHTFETTRP